MVREISCQNTTGTWCFLMSSCLLIYSWQLFHITKGLISLIVCLICLTMPCTAAGRAGPLQAAPSSSCPTQWTPARCADPRIKPSAKNKTTNSSSMPGDYPRNQVIFILELMPRNKRTNQLPPIISSREAASEVTSLRWRSWLLRIC